ncbi:MAG: hypothetical protein M3Q87_05820 [Actinomycetota bacterium]|nr:hypothetical protein [Actinomycetota bacterium]
MFLSVPVRVALCVAVALALSLMCAVLAFAASTVPMTGMTGIAGGSDISVVAGTGKAAVATAAGPVVGDIVADAGPVMASTCDDACVTAVSDMCSFAAGLAVSTLLALLLAFRRDTFMGTLARNRPSALARRPRRKRTPWTVLSPFSLCVLRV